MGATVGVCVCVLVEEFIELEKADPSHVTAASHYTLKLRKGKKGQGIGFILYKLATSQE